MCCIGVTEGLEDNEHGSQAEQTFQQIMSVESSAACV